MSALRELLLAGDLRTTVGLRALNLNGELLRDLSSQVVAGTAIVRRTGSRKRSSQAEFTCVLRQELPWTSVILAPSITVTNRSVGTSQTWEMGWFLPTSPTRVRGQTDEFEVTAYDLLHVYNTPITDSIRAKKGDPVLSSLRTLLSSKGRWPGFNFAFSFPAEPSTFAQDHVWSLTEGLTYLDVANQVLSLNGYRHLWSARDGSMTTEPADLLIDRGSEWSIDGTKSDGQIQDRSTVSVDTWSTPNVWLGIDNNPADDLPTEQNGGIYRVLNERTGPTSIEARGREVNEVVTTDAANVAALARLVEAAAEADVAASERISLSLSPLPFLWHLNTVRLNDPLLALFDVPAVVRSWSLPLDGGTMEVVCDRLYRVVVP